MDTQHGVQTSTRLVAPGPRGEPLLGSFRALHRMGQVPFYLDSWRRYGDLVRFRLGPLVAHIIVHPDHVRHVLAGNRHNYAKGLGYAKTQGLLGQGLLTSEGELWQRQRRLMQPPFTARAVVQFGPEMTEAAEALFPRWRAHATTGEPLDIHEEMLRLALGIIGRTMFGADVSGASEEMVHAYHDACHAINQRLASFLDVPLAVPTPFNRRFKRAVTTLDRLVFDLIAARRHAAPRDDLLGKLLAARDPESGAAMSDAQLRDEIMTIFFAGHETSAVALTWTWYLLAQAPGVEATLHAELDGALGGRTPTVDDLPRLAYTRMVVEEALRLYPPVWTFPRQAVEEDEIGGYLIPAGSLIFPTQYCTHRHPEFWQEPARFDPLRFTLEQVEARHHYAYYPFGGGPRTCIGIHFARQELVLLLATLAQHFRLHLLSDQQIEPRSIITLHPSAPVWVRVEARE